MALLSIVLEQFQNAHYTSLSTQGHIGSQGKTILFGLLLFTTLHTCTDICPTPTMFLLMISFIGPSFLVINSARSMFGNVWCISLIQEYEMVKIYFTGNQSPGMEYFLGIALIIPVTPHLVLNLTTAHTYPQYNVVPGDTFSTIQYISDYEDHPVFWNDVATDNFTHQVPLKIEHSTVLHLFKFHMIPCHMFLLPFPAMILPHILQLRSIYKFSPMKIQV